MKQTKENKGITLIALVVTIIILLILVGVSIAALTRENGLFEKAKIAKQRQTEAEVKEKINLLVSEYAIEKEQGKTLSDFLAEKKDSGKIDDFVDNNDGTFDIIIDGYTVTINESNLSTTEPQILSDIVVTCLAKKFIENKVEALITVKSQSGGIKEVRLINNVTVQGNNKLLIAFDNKIEANIEYQVEVELTNGTVVTKTIKYEDTEAPTATIEIAKKIIFNSGKIQANIKLEDNKSGVNISECKWIAVKSSEKLGTEDGSKYTGTFKSETETIQTEEITEEGEYYIHLLLKDNIGNVTEVISEKIEIKDGFEISTPEELQAIGTNLSGHYYVTKDIDMADFNFTPIEGSFKGTIDGQGHIIYNFSLNAYSENIGMFKIINKAIFKNILFKDVNIRSEYSGIGVIAGNTEFNTSYFYNIGITGNIEGIDNVGSFIGYANGGGVKFENCYARTNVTTNKNSSSAGGFVGYRRTCNMSADKCYFYGHISDIATEKGAIFPTGDIKGRKITNSYYNSDLFNIQTSYMYSGNGITTDEFKNIKNFEGWNFNEENGDWYMGADGYPELKF